MVRLKVFYILPEYLHLENVPMRIQQSHIHIEERIHTLTKENKCYFDEA